MKLQLLQWPTWWCLWDGGRCGAHVNSQQFSPVSKSPLFVAGSGGEEGEGRGEFNVARDGGVCRKKRERCEKEEREALKGDGNYE